MKNKQELIQDVIDRELDMFLNVPAREPATCQENPGAFRFYRGVLFSVWSEPALESYRDDLIRADAKGLNLLTLKYASMEKYSKEPPFAAKDSSSLGTSKSKNINLDPPYVDEGIAFPALFIT